MMQEKSMQQFWESSPFSGGNAAYIETLYETYLSNPHQVPEEWRVVFAQLPAGLRANGADLSHVAIRNYFLERSKNAQRNGLYSAVEGLQQKQTQVQALIHAYRRCGHLRAKLDPLGLKKPHALKSLTLAYHNLTAADLATRFCATDLSMSPKTATLAEMVAFLEKVYCQNIAVEFMHVLDADQRLWFQERFESVLGSGSPLSAEKKRILLQRLQAAEGLENYLAARYPGTKRFGLEGAETLIPMTDEMIFSAGSYGTQEMILGMAHRGRLNILVNILGKQPKDLFDEFEGRMVLDKGSGDVKYHLGFSTNVMTGGGEMHLAMAFNPSHLEIVSPVVEGSVRARQDRRDDNQGQCVLPVCLHGDAAFAGQGVVMETLQMSQTRGYKTGGTIHVMINNQIGFTTSRTDDARSTEYCTDVAKMIDAPVLHVNADDPEAAVHAAKLAVDFRMTFKKDVIIDLVCYRRRGHNEADEPSATQPVMYQKIKEHKSTPALYAQRLIEESLITPEESQKYSDAFRAKLDAGFKVANALVKDPDRNMFVDWTPYLGHEWTARHDTRVSLPVLQEIARKMVEVPQDFALQKQVQKIYDDRRKMAAGALPVNWGFAETLAYATLLREGHPIRLTGQDVGRGTFSHRHAVLHNQKDGSTYVPLEHIDQKQPAFAIYDSLLSEEAVLAFEYGYATTMPNYLVIWEAQFGDFANGAQVVIDQFITSGENKWGRLCGLTLLLPHGYEGMGPEHSSARLERFLQLSAEQNIQVCVPTTPAQVFHMLRRQVLRPLRKPLVVFSPKSLLRHKRAVSTIDDLANGAFQTVIANHGEQSPETIVRVILCSGKVYYDLLEKRETDSDFADTALVRIEQLYPFPQEVLEQVLALYKQVKIVVWCQEEPMNQGAWYSSQHHFCAVLSNCGLQLPLLYAGRNASAAPACGYMSVHVEQQKKLVHDAFTLKGKE